MSKEPVVPQGGLTGLVDATQSNLQELAMSLERMNSIEEIDVQSRTMTVQAGVPLQRFRNKQIKQECYSLWI
jgi:FAD/FMN-containing dehydrogenase